MTRRPSSKLCWENDVKVLIVLGGDAPGVELLRKPARTRRICPLRRTGGLEAFDAAGRRAGSCSSAIWIPSAQDVVGTVRRPAGRRTAELHQGRHGRRRYALDVALSQRRDGNRAARRAGRAARPCAGQRDAGCPRRVVSGAWARDPRGRTRRFGASMDETRILLTGAKGEHGLAAAAGRGATA